ncbi:hypothetical protein Tco_0201509 [Tanacetum coccineum]
METKATLSLCSDLDEQEIQQLQKQAKILKKNSLNKLNALKTTIQHLSSSNSSMYYEFRETFHRLFNADVGTFKDVLSRNMQNLERKLNKETLYEKDSNSGLSMIKVQFDNFIHSRVLELSNYNSHALEITQDFKAYTNMEAQTFKEKIIQNMDSIEQCIVERARHEQDLQNRLKRLNERKLQIQECKIQEVKASNACSADTDSSGIVSDKGNDQSLENHINTSGDESSRSRNECNDKRTFRDDMDIKSSYDTELMVEVPYTAEYNVFAVDTQHSEQPECIINTCVVEKIQKQLKKANASLTQELKECKSTLAKTSRTLGESNSIQDSCLVALQNKHTELEKYMAFNDRTVDYDKLERKLNETLGLLAQKEIDIKEGLKVKAYEISVVKEKHDELVKQSLLTKSHYEGLVKEKTKVITDLKLKEEKDIDKMISMEKQLKFLNEIVYKRNQSIQTIHMIAHKGPTFNGRPTFANPMYLKKAQYEKPCLYEIPHDQSDPANKLVPDREETLTLERESRSKLNKDLNDSFTFVHELKQEMHADLKYVESLEKEIDELESDKAEFSNLYNRLLKSSFAKPYDVNAPGHSRNIPKHVSFQSPRESVGLNDMVHNYYLEEAKKKAQLQKDKALNTKPSV